MATRLVYGVGINDMPLGSCSERTGSKNIPYIWYRAWNGMLRRCYDPKFLRKWPTYEGCSVASEWHRLSIFKGWFDANYQDGFHLDKDILVPGNKVYSSDTCCLVPPRINTLITNQKPQNTGVHYIVDGGGYIARTSRNGSPFYAGYYATKDEAAVAYKEVKRAVVKEVAIAAFLANEIKSDVYLALVRREF